MGKDIYCVYDTKDHKIVESGFEKKPDAKHARDEHNKVHQSSKDGDVMPRFIVSRGEDHGWGPSSRRVFTKTSKRKR
jgi:hypothetical protein